MLAIIMYHFIRDHKDLLKLNLKGITNEQFIKQLNFLKKNYDIISYQDLDIIFKKKKKDKYVLLTFDDGYIEHYKFVLPELINSNIKGVFSVPLINFSSENYILDINKIQMIANFKKFQTNIIDKIFFYLQKTDVDSTMIKKKYYTRGRLDDKKTNLIKKILQNGYKFRNKKISDLIFSDYYSNKTSFISKNLYFSKKNINKFIKNDMTFCSHGVSHAKLVDLNKKDLEKELKESKNFLLGINNKSKYGVVYPHGLTNIKIKKSASNIGYVYGFVGGKSLVNNFEKVDKMNLHRIDTADFQMLKK